MSRELSGFSKVFFQYRQNLQHLPVRGMPTQPSGRSNPYATDNEEDIYFRLISRFAIDFEKMYLNWLHEALAHLEGEEAP